ncbi:MAG: sigma-70 family RNA polymerase sigma factor [Planctomycetota bacterium]|jgi:RNA polymerase sigma factor (sigma-70 family)
MSIVESSAIDCRVTKASACQKAVKVAEWVASGSGLDGEPDEKNLFISMHACAYQSEKRPRKKPIDPHERAKWIKRWNLIREYIVEKNLGLIYTMIGLNGSKERDGDDLLSDAMFGLFQAIDHFNPWKGYRFSTYACTVIGRLLRRQGRREVNYRQMFPVQNDGSLEGVVNMPDSPKDRTELFVERLNRALEQNLGKLTELESTIVALRFPTDNQRIHTFLEIGKSVGLSKERVRQIQNIALQKLRNVLLEDPILSD